VLWLGGYYHGEGHNTIIEPDALKKNEDKLNQYCFEHGETIVMDALKNMGLGKRWGSCSRFDALPTSSLPAQR
jgi:hypothetical protein